MLFRMSAVDFTKLMERYQYLRVEEDKRIQGSYGHPEYPELTNEEVMLQAVEKVFGKTYVDLIGADNPTILMSLHPMTPRIDF